MRWNACLQNGVVIVLVAFLVLPLPVIAQEGSEIITEAWCLNLGKAAWPIPDWASEIAKDLPTDTLADYFYIINVIVGLENQFKEVYYETFPEKKGEVDWGDLRFEEVREMRRFFFNLCISRDQWQVMHVRKALPGAVNVRERPTTDARVVRRILPGTRIRVLCLFEGQFVLGSESWCVFDGRREYIHSSLLIDRETGRLGNM